MEYYVLIAIWFVLSILVTGGFYSYNNRKFTDDLYNGVSVTVIGTALLLIFWPVILLWFAGRKMGEFFATE